MNEIEKFLAENPPSSEFSPFAFYNKDGDHLEVYWDNEMDYTTPVKDVMHLHQGQDTGKITGVTVYSLKRILDEAGFTLVPKDEPEQMPRVEALRSAMLHCSHYESGTRYCDFCGAELAGYTHRKPGAENTEHKKGCPFFSLKHSD